MTALSTPPTRRAGAERAVTDVYLDLGEAGGAAAQLHAPATDPSRDIGVVICPPFGWEEVAAHRALRAWASALAESGHPVACLTYPGTGDSPGSPLDCEPLASWRASVSAAADVLRQRTGAHAVIALAIGFGGYPAQLAAEDGGLDGLVLWATPPRGRDFLRGLRVFSRIEAGEAYADQPTPEPVLEAGALEAGGFVLGAAAVDVLGAVDLRTSGPPLTLPLGTLLIGRDGASVDPEHAAALIERGVEVTTGTGGGYERMTSHPQEALLPRRIVGDIAAWLDRGRLAPARAERGRAPVPVSDRLLLGEPDAHFTERPLIVDSTHGAARGVLVEPDHRTTDLCVVFLNAGAIGHIGPSRFWVDLGRRWAELGISSARVDLNGIGDAPGGERPYADTGRLYDRGLVAQVGEVLDALQDEGVARRFVLIGMCSGAHWALHRGLEDSRVIGSQLVNLAVIVYDERLTSRRLLRAVSPRSILHLRRAETRAALLTLIRSGARALRRRLRAGTGVAGQSLSLRTDAVIEALRVEGKPVLLLFSAREALDDELVRVGRMAEVASWPNVTLERVAVVSHTLRPAPAREAAREILERHLLAMVGSPSNPPVRASGPSSDQAPA